MIKVLGIRNELKVGAEDFAAFFLGSDSVIHMSMLSVPHGILLFGFKNVSFW